MVRDVLDLGYPTDRPYLVPDEMKSAADYIIWRADGEFEWCDADGFHTDQSYWKPSIHMPREAARIFLPVKSVRVERLREISPRDCAAEGVLLRRWKQEDAGHGLPQFDLGVESDNRELRNKFHALWDSIYSKRGLGWDENPYVWVIGWDKPEVKHA
jgi:hypothetical protein